MGQPGSFRPRDLNHDLHLPTGSVPDLHETLAGYKHMSLLPVSLLPSPLPHILGALTTVVLVRDEPLYQLDVRSEKCLLLFQTCPGITVHMQRMLATT